jgi:hypothetical protein
MNLSSDSTTEYYAVISVRNSSPRERVIIAYPDEKSLRKLIADPSILALGYRSRAEALAYREDVSPLACALPHEANATSNRTVTQTVPGSRAIRATKVRVDLPITRKRFTISCNTPWQWLLDSSIRKTWFQACFGLSCHFSLSKLPWVAEGSTIGSPHVSWAFASFLWSVPAG